MNEDERAAANITVTLSTQLMAASVAVLAIVGAFSVFAYDKRDVPGWIIILLAATFLIFVASIGCGGRGVNEVRRAMVSRTWTLQTGGQMFRLQVSLNILGLSLFFAFLLFALAQETREDAIQAELADLKRAVLSQNSRCE